MKNRKGFTLTEVLLAIMIVGLIAVALASLTRAAARESGAGRSKIMLRNNLSMFMRTLRKDMSQSTYVQSIRGALGSVGTEPVVLLQTAQNVDSQGQTITTSSTGALTPKWITYCFVRGNDNTNITPVDAYRGGAIYRYENNTRFANASDCASGGELVLDNVKYIPGGWPVPLFVLNDFSRNHTNSLMTVRLITELRSTPVINDVVDETFAVPNGY